jgi:hypothetical protein
MWGDPRSAYGLWSRHWLRPELFAILITVTRRGSAGIWLPARSVLCKPSSGKSRNTRCYNVASLGICRKHSSEMPGWCRYGERW